MTVQVEVAGRVRTVVLQPAAAPGTYRVRVDERCYDVRASRSGADGLLVSAVPLELADGKASARPADKPIGGAGSTPQAGGAVLPPRTVSEVFVTPLGSHLLVNVGGRTIAAGVNGRRQGPGADVARPTHGEARVVAPMPGRVVRVLVGPGDVVTVRQPLVVVEAMKMENELRAPKAGRVREITVGAGASVEAGRVLLVIE